MNNAIVPAVAFICFQVLFKASEAAAVQSKGMERRGCIPVCLPSNDAGDAKLGSQRNLRPPGRHGAAVFGWSLLWFDPVQLFNGTKNDPTVHFSALRA